LESSGDLETDLDEEFVDRRRPVGKASLVACAAAAELLKPSVAGNCAPPRNAALLVEIVDATMPRGHHQEPRFVVSMQRAQPHPSTTAKWPRRALIMQLAAHSLRISETLNRRIEEDSAQQDGFSYANTLLCLCAEVLNTFRSLAEAHFKNQVQHTAWLSRNLLELSIWCEYCARSESNARLFYFETMKDALGIVNAFASLASMDPTETSGKHRPAE
jgi:hypothetical protein